MGSSKVILVSGLCVMLGFYAYTIQKATESIVASGTHQRAVTQARLLSNAALNLSCYYLSTSFGSNLVGTNKEISVDGSPFKYRGTMSWSIDTTYYSSDNKVIVTTTGIFGMDTVVQKATLSKGVTVGTKKRWNQWGLASILIRPPQMHEEGYMANMRY